MRATRLSSVTTSAAAKTTAKTIGKNIECSVDANGIMTLRIDTKARLGDSASGKTTIVATTSGNLAVDGTEGVIIGLNAYVKK